MKNQWAIWKLDTVTHEWVEISRWNDQLEAMDIRSMHGSSNRER